MCVCVCVCVCLAVENVIKLWFWNSVVKIRSAFIT